MTDRPMSETERALIQMVVDARDDPKRVPDALIRQYAVRVALETVTPEELARLQILYDVQEDAKADFSDALDALPAYARRPTMAKLERSRREADEAAEAAESQGGMDAAAAEKFAERVKAL
jgi:hypothetical protein